jgi:zinc protease
MPARYAPDAYPLELASDILAAGESSRLYQDLVYKQRIAVQAAGFGDFSEDPNLFWAYAIMDQGHTGEEGEKAVVNVLDQLKTQPVEPEELEKAKNQEIAAAVLGRDSDEDKAVAIENAAVIGKDPNLVNSELDRYLAVTPADIQRVAKDYFEPQHATVIFRSGSVARHFNDSARCNRTGRSRPSSGTSGGFGQHWQSQWNWRRAAGSAARSAAPCACAA